MTEDEAIALTREYLESQFPKPCARCGRVYRSLADYLRHTTHAGDPLSFDAEAGDWRPLRPLGTISVAHCPCGTSLSISSASMPITHLWRLMAFVRGETKRRGLSVRQVLGELRGKIDARVLGSPGE